MGIGPTAAIPKLLSKYSLTKEDIDIFEINEALCLHGGVLPEHAGIGT